MSGGRGRDGRNNCEMILKKKRQKISLIKNNSSFVKIEQQIGLHTFVL